MATRLKLLPILLIAASALTAAGCKDKRRESAGKPVEPTAEPARELPAIDDNSAVGEVADGFRLDLRSLYRHLTTADPFQLALRITNAATRSGAPSPEFDLRATVAALEFVLIDPQGNETRLKIKDTSSEPWRASFAPTAQVVELAASGLTMLSISFPWAAPPKKLFDSAGSYKLRVSGELVMNTRRVKLKSGELTFEVTQESPAQLSLSVLHSIAAKLVAERQQLSAPPKPRSETVEDRQGNRSFRYRLNNAMYDVTIVEVTLSSAGKEILYDVYTHFSCVVAGTPIETPSGPTPVEQLHVGSEVTAYDVAAKRRTVARVLEVRSAHAERVVQLGALRLTGKHPVFAGGQWTRAEDLAPNAVLLGSDLKPIQLTATPLAQPNTVYDLSVTEPHTYFAGGLLLHNKAVSVPIGGEQPWSGYFYRRAAKQ